MSALIHTDRLTKNYGRSRGILDVTFEVQEGEIFGFLGAEWRGENDDYACADGPAAPKRWQRHH